MTKIIKIADITNYLETIAPLSYQESYDNAGLLVGDSKQAVIGILCTLDCTEEVVKEAIEKKCNLIIAHHPIVFSGLKRFTGRNYVEKTIIQAIKNDIAIYAIHTNLDHVLAGVNAKICQKIGLQNTKILAPKRNILKKLQVFVPPTHTQVVLDALAEAGAGMIGNYSRCSFVVAGEGSFQANDKANPTIGKANSLEKVTENSIEVIFAAANENKILAALRKAHPYEEIAYYVYNLENENQEVGAGMIGELEKPLEIQEFLAKLKLAMDLQVLKYTKLAEDKKIKKVAVCGGAGGFLLKNAIAAGADIFITADYKYHEFFDAEQKIRIVDIGHYESEQFTKELLVELLTPIFTDIKMIESTINTNPIAYF
jgi:dinuclear metal center YbgI/SA1388 family protein